MPLDPSASAPLSSYLAIREMVEQGLYEKAALRARELRTVNSPEWNTLRLLISARVAIKTLGKIGEDVFTALDPNQTRDGFLKAELHFARGLYLFHQGDFTRGVTEFENAQALYQKANLLERELLSAYNVYSGKVNAKLMLEPLDCLAELRELERIASTAKNKKLLGIILREKSENLQQLDKTLAAAEAAEQSVRLLELYGAKSDYHLALIQAADLACDQDQKKAALTFIDRIILPVDHRVEFALKLVEARLHQTPAPTPEATTVLVDMRKWQKRFGMAAQKTEDVYQWNIKNQVLQTGVALKIKDSSLEGKLLKTLMSGPMSKSRLSESLWPEHCGQVHLDNRLHRLVSRFNQKTEGLIKFDGQRYLLQKKVVVTSA